MTCEHIHGAVRTFDLDAEGRYWLLSLDCHDCGASGLAVVDEALTPPEHRTAA